jgi:preprotein translocase subunit SecD
MKEKNSMRRATLLFLLFIGLLAAAAAYVDWPNNPGIHVLGYNNPLTVKEGLDLQGGVQVLLQAKGNYSGAELAKAMPAARDAIERRVNGGLGVNEPVIRLEGNQYISVELPGLKNEQEAVQTLLKTGELDFYNTGQQAVPLGTTITPGEFGKPVFTGKDLDPNSLSAGLDPQTGQPVINFAMVPSEQKAFFDFTSKNVGNYLTVTLDGKVIESAVIQSAINGNGIIQGDLTITQAQDIAQLLKYGALPIPLQIVSEQEIGPTLGAASIHASIIAGIIGLSMVIFFMLVYYRMPGLLADCALILYAGLTFAVFKVLGVVLTLAGIAGFILSIGMAVDANVLIFERIKEELRGGRTLSSAIEVGFKRAFPSIRDSNISTLITCAILWWFGNTFGATIIVGFATTLALGVALSLFTAITVTRNFLNVLVPLGVGTHPWFFGLPADAIKVPTFTRGGKRMQLAEE